MYYIVYKISNMMNNKFYIGMHQTTNVLDDYMGSGKLIRSAIKKYGLENFEKEILFVFKTEQEMRDKEAELVSDEFLDEHRDVCYNLLSGGKGGFGYLNRTGRNSRIGKVLSEETKQKISISKKGKKNPHSSVNAKKHLHSPEVRCKIREKLLGSSKTNAHKQNISKALLGVVQKKVICPHCNKEGGSRSMKRWHFDNCTTRGYRI